MTARLWQFGIGLVVAAISLMASVAFSQSSSSAVAITLDAKNTIQAGDSWTVTVNVTGAAAGDQAPVMLVNGLRTFETVLTLGSGGVAIWEIPAGEITQAGDSLAVVRYRDHSQRHVLRVRPLGVESAELFSTSNSLPAYGEGSATIIMLPLDALGNSPDNTTLFDLNTRFPDGTQNTTAFDYQNGLGYLSLRSQGTPGRVRLTLDGDDVPQANLELLQVAGEPTQVTMTVTPDCVLNDGRDLITLRAQVMDDNGYPVSDGTLVTFRWFEGLGYGRTIDGQAQLIIPAPTRIVVHNYYARAGDVESSGVPLLVTRERCDAE